MSIGAFTRIHCTNYECTNKNKKLQISLAKHNYKWNYLAIRI